MEVATPSPCDKVVEAVTPGPCDGVVEVTTPGPCDKVVEVAPPCPSDRVGWCESMLTPGVAVLSLALPALARGTLDAFKRERVMTGRFRGITADVVKRPA